MARIVPATSEWIEEAARAIASGGLVAFPTETVYGLGANVLDADAVERIFAAKGRPSTNPVIVHISKIAQLANLVADVPENAKKLADAFWPGPLTMVLPKSANVPDIVTAGGATVGVRMPDHDVALELIRLAGVPIAAPSANRSEEISPTTAHHVADSLGDAVDLIIDGGPCKIGIESTVLDLSSDKPRILRPGSITIAQIEAVLGTELSESATDDGNVARSPGQMPRHYAPKKHLTLFSYSRDPNIWRQSEQESLAVIGRGETTATTETKVNTVVIEGNVRAKVVTVPLKADTYASDIYSLLRELDSDPDVLSIEVEEPPDTPEWAAVRDRLKRAATPKAQTD